MIGIIRFAGWLSAAAGLIVAGYVLLEVPVLDSLTIVVVAAWVFGGLVTLALCIVLAETRELVGEQHEMLESVLRSVNAIRGGTLYGHEQDYEEDDEEDDEY